MVMLVWWLIDRLRPLAALLAVAGIAGATFDGYAQQQTQDPAPKRPQSTKPAKPVQKPNAAAEKPSAKKPTITQRTDGLPPSQVGIGTLAQLAFMVVPLSWPVLMFS